MASSGIYAFSQPFSIEIIGLHALSGFLFIGVVVGHILNNIVSLKKYFKHGTAMAVGLAVALFTALFYYQPAPIKAVLGLSGNLGPALDMFELNEKGLSYQYSPDPGYKLLLDVRTGPSYDPQNPPHLAIWLENQSLYHIKTLFVADSFPQNCDRVNCTNGWFEDSLYRQPESPPSESFKCWAPSKYFCSFSSSAVSAYAAGSSSPSFS